MGFWTTESLFYSILKNVWWKVLCWFCQNEKKIKLKENAYNSNVSLNITYFKELFNKIKQHIYNKYCSWKQFNFYFNFFKWLIVPIRRFSVCIWSPVGFRIHGTGTPGSPTATGARGALLGEEVPASQRALGHNAGRAPHALGHAAWHAHRGGHVGTGGHWGAHTVVWGVHALHTRPATTKKHYKLEVF